MSDTMIRCDLCGTLIWGTTARANDKWRAEHAAEHISSTGQAS